jgi:hypothetical protein
MRALSGEAGDVRQLVDEAYFDGMRPRVEE